MKNFIDLCRCDRSGVYAESCALVIKTAFSTEREIYRNGFFILYKNSLKFNFSEISKLYYNIIRLNSPLFNGVVYYLFLNFIMWEGYFLLMKTGRSYEK